MSRRPSDQDSFGTLLGQARDAMMVISIAPQERREGWASWVLPLTFHVSLGNSLHLSRLQIPYLKNGDDTAFLSVLQTLWRKRR